MPSDRTPSLTAAHVESVRRDMPDLGPPPGTLLFEDEDYRAQRDRLLQDWTPGEDLLVFAYGSLIWKPGCPIVSQEPATLTGWHRKFCFRIVRFRGCEDRPGLMMTVDRGGTCKGVVQRLAAADVPERLEQVLRREQLYKPSSHKPIWVTVKQGARRVPAITFVIDRQAKAYVPDLTPEQQADMIAFACGQRGPCAEYLLNTVEHLEALGIHDRYLWQLTQELVGGADRPAMGWALSRPGRDRAGGGGSPGNRVARIAGGGGARAAGHERPRSATGLRCLQPPRMTPPRQQRAGARSLSRAVSGGTGSILGGEGGGCSGTGSGDVGGDGPTGREAVPPA